MRERATRQRPAFHGEKIAAIFLVLGRYRSELVRRKGITRQGRWFDWDWLGWPVLIAWSRIVIRNWNLVHIEDRLAGQAIEDEKQSLLGDLRYGRDLLPVLFCRYQDGAEARS